MSRLEIAPTFNTICSFWTTRIIIYPQRPLGLCGEFLGILKFYGANQTLLDHYGSRYFVYRSCLHILHK